jgi:prepilin-type processing-associated H-X9-DG protein
MLLEFVLWTAVASQLSTSDSHAHAGGGGSDDGIGSWAWIATGEESIPRFALISSANPTLDASGTIMLVEQPEGGNIAGNDWPSFSQGPTGPASGDQTPFQIAIKGRQNWGEKAYGLHGKRFNYLFFDGHVGIHKITDTVGTGTTNAPKGMWTMTAGD